MPNYHVIETGGAWHSGDDAPPRWTGDGLTQLEGGGRNGQNAVRLGMSNYLSTDTGHAGNDTCASLWMKRFVAPETASAFDFIVLNYPDGSYVSMGASLTGDYSENLQLHFSYSTTGSPVLETQNVLLYRYVDDELTDTALWKDPEWIQFQLRVHRDPAAGTVTLKASVGGTEVASFVTPANAANFADAANDGQPLCLNVFGPGIYDPQTQEWPRACDILMTDADAWIPADATVVHLRPSAVVTDPAPQYDEPSAGARLTVAAADPTDTGNPCTTSATNETDLFEIDPPADKTVLGATVTVLTESAGSLATRPVLRVGGVAQTAVSTVLQQTPDEHHARTIACAINTLTGVDIGWQSYGTAGAETSARGLCLDVIVTQQAATPRIVFVEGFDYIDALVPAGFPSGWNGRFPKLTGFAAADPLFDPVGSRYGGREGGGCWKRGAAGSIEGYGVHDGRKVTVLRLNGLDGGPTIGFAMKLGNAPGPCDLVAFGAGLPKVRFNAEGRVEVAHGTSVFTSAESFHAGAWAYVEASLCLDIATRKVATVTVRVDNMEWVSASFSYAAAFPSNQTYDLELLAPLCGAAGTHPETWVDDLYVALDSYFLGNVHVRPSRVTGAGSLSEWVGSALTMVEDVATHDVNGSFHGKTSRADNKTDLYAHAPLTHSGTIVAVAVTAFGYATGGSGTWALALKSGATTDLKGTAAMTVDDAYGASVHGVWSSNPNGPVAWTEGAVNATEFGYKVLDNPYEAGTENEARCWYALMEVLVGGVALDLAPDTATTRKDEPVTVEVLDNDLGLEPLTVVSATVPAHGTTLISGGSTSVTYTPNEGWTGTDTFNYMAQDALGGTGTATVTVNVVSETDDSDSDPYRFGELVQESTIKKRHRIRRWRVAYGDDDLETFQASQIPYGASANLPRAVGGDDVWFASGYSVQTSDTMAADQINLSIVSGEDGEHLRFFNYNDLVTIDEEWVGERGSLGWIRRASGFIDSEPGELSSADRQGQLTLRGAAKLLMLRPFRGDMRADKIHVGVPEKVELTCVNFADPKEIDYYRFVHATEPLAPETHHTAQWCDRPHPRIFVGNTNRQVRNQDGVMQIVFGDGEVIIGRDFYDSGMKEGGLGGHHGGYKDGLPFLKMEYWRWALPQDEIPVIVEAVWAGGGVSFYGQAPDATWIGSSFTVDEGGPGAVGRRFKIRAIGTEGATTVVYCNPDKYGDLPSDAAVGLADGDTGVVFDANLAIRRIREVALDAGFQASQPFDRDKMTGLFHIRRLDDPAIEVHQSDTVASGALQFDLGTLNKVFDTWTQDFRRGMMSTVVHVERDSASDPLTVTVKVIGTSYTQGMGVQVYDNAALSLGGSLFGAPTFPDMAHTSGTMALNSGAYERSVEVQPGNYTLFVKMSTWPAQSYSINLSEEFLATMTTTDNGSYVSRLTIPSLDDFNVRESDERNHQAVLEEMWKSLPTNYQYWVDEDTCFNAGVVRMVGPENGAYVVTEKEKLSRVKTDNDVRTKYVYRMRDPELRNVTRSVSMRTLAAGDAWPDGETCIKWPALPSETTIDGHLYDVSIDYSTTVDAQKTSAVFDTSYSTKYKASYSAGSNDDMGDSIKAHLWDGSTLFEIVLADTVEPSQVNIRGNKDMNGEFSNCRIRLDYSSDGPDVQYPYWEEMVPEFEFTQQAKNVAAFTEKDFGDKLRVRRVRLVLLNAALNRVDDKDAPNYTRATFGLVSFSLWPVDILEGSATLGETDGFDSQNDRDLARRLNAGAPRTQYSPFVDEMGYHLARLIYPMQHDVTLPDGTVTPARRVRNQKYADQRAREYLAEVSKDFSMLSLDGVRPDLRARDTVYVTQPELGIDNVPFYVREVSAESAGKVSAKMAPFLFVPWMDTNTDSAAAAATTVTGVFSVNPSTVTVPYGSGSASVTLSPQPKVRVLGTNGLTDTAFVGTAVLSLKPGLGNPDATLLASGGTAGLSVAVVNGTATFTGITLNRPGSYALQALLHPASGADLGPFAGAPFVHIAPDPDAVHFLASPAGPLTFDAEGHVTLPSVVVRAIKPVTSAIDTTFAGWCDLSIVSGETGATLTAGTSGLTQVDPVTVRATFSDGLATFSGTGAVQTVLNAGNAGAMVKGYVLGGTAFGTWSGANGSAYLTCATPEFKASRLDSSSFFITVQPTTRRSSLFLPVRVTPDTCVPEPPALGSPKVVDLSPFLDGVRTTFPLPHGVGSAGGLDVYLNGVQGPPDSAALTGTSALTTGTAVVVTSLTAPSGLAAAPGTGRLGQTMTNGESHRYTVTTLAVRGFGLSGNRYAETTPCLPVGGTALASGGIRLTWNAVPHAAGYAVYRDMHRVAQLGPATTSFTDDAGYTPDTAVHPPSRNGCLWSRLLPAVDHAGRRYEDRLLAAVPYRYVGVTAPPRRVGAYYHPCYKAGENMTGHYPTLPSTPDYSSSAWQQGELSAMKAAGFDWCVLSLPTVPTDYTDTGKYGTALGNVVTPTSFGFHSGTSLATFVTAVNALGASAPKAAFCWDTRAMGNADLSDSKHLDWVNNSLWNFYDRFYSGGAFGTALASHNGAAFGTAAASGHPVLVLRAPQGMWWGTGAATSIGNAFAARYGGVPLFVLFAGWPSADPDLDLGAYRGDHVIPGRECMTIGPGWDSSYGTGSAAMTVPTRSREDGNVFIHAWQSACNAGPRIVLVDSWNEMQNGTSVCPSVEFGALFGSINADYAARFHAGETPAIAVHPALPSSTRSTGWYPGTGSSGLTSVYGRCGYRAAEDGIRLVGSLSMGHTAAFAAPDSTAGMGTADLAIRPAWPSGIRRVPGTAEVALVRGGCLAFDIADALVFENASNTYTVSVLYWDAPVDAGLPAPSIWLEYDAWGDPSDPSNLYRDAGSPVALTGTSEWKTASWTLTDAYFGNRQEFGADFRLHFWPAPVWVTVLRVAAL